MANQPYFEDYSVDDEIPVVTERCDEAQLFFFSAATNNGHRIHYDLPFAKEEGHETILVHGPLQAALMAKTLTDWAGPEGRLVKIGIQNRASAYPHEDLMFGAKVVAKREVDGRYLLDLETFEKKADGRVIMPGNATVSLPSRG